MLLPLFASGLLSCAKPAPPQSLPDAALVERFEALHRPIYGVYELGEDRDAIWELLDRSFTGEALTREYIEHFTTLASMKSEETSIQVLRVDYESVSVLERLPSGQVRVEADWSVGGVVTHQAHKHTRVNRYVAVYTLTETGAGWRIEDTRMRDLERVRSVLSNWASDDAFLLDEMPTGASGMMDPLEMLNAGLGAKQGAPSDEDADPDPVTSPAPEGE